MQLSPIILILFTAAPAGASPGLSEAELRKAYEEREMRYAAELRQDGNPDAAGELRSRKTEKLDHRIRESAIRKLEAQLKRNRDSRLRREILHRLVQLYEQQAELLGRRNDLKDRELLTRQALRNAVLHLERIRREYPDWSADAILFDLAENHAKLKEERVAENFYRELINRFPKSSVVADSLLSLGNLYFERQLFETARSFYGRILGTPEENLHPYAHYKVAWCHFNERETAAAISGLERAILESRKISAKASKRLGVEDEALSDLVLFHAESGKPEEAKAHFERIAGPERARELRFQLARKLYEDGKHELAKNAVRRMLEEGADKEQAHRLYLILISASERTKDRTTGLDAARKLASWVEKEKPEKGSGARIETEEYLRHYTQKLHYEAETLKGKETWAQARKSYEIYLQTFPDAEDAGDVKFRFAVLLMNQKDNSSAYREVDQAIRLMNEAHPRFKEALKLRLQAIELATATERERIPKKDVVAAYDAYANAFADEDLGIEAGYKAAIEARTIEEPEKVAERFRALATRRPEHPLAKSSVSEALSVLVKAEKWDALSRAAKGLSSQSFQAGGAMDEALKKKLEEARELADVKLTEGLEKDGKIAEAMSRYELILKESPTPTLGTYALLRMASIQEKQLNQLPAAIRTWERIRERQPDSKEGRNALLEIARLEEKVHKPQEAATRYREFAEGGNGQLEQQALTNAAVLLDRLGRRMEASQTFFRLAEAQAGKAGASQAFEAGCNSALLASHGTKDEQVLRRILDCSKRLAGSSERKIPWQARAAWAATQLNGPEQAMDLWRKIAGKGTRNAPEEDRAYITMARIKLLESQLELLKAISFTRTNERPEANIGKKMRALEEFEKQAQAALSAATAQQSITARGLIRQAYLNVAETMDSAALPSRITESQRSELKASFQKFAGEFRTKAETIHAAAEAQRSPASPGKTEELPKFFEKASLSGEEERWLETGTLPKEKAAEVYAKKAASLFQQGKFGEARFFGEKWKEQLPDGSPAGFGSSELGSFERLLSSKLPDTDPLGKDF